MHNDEIKFRELIEYARLGDPKVCVWHSLDTTCVLCGCVIPRGQKNFYYSEMSFADYRVCSGCHIKIQKIAEADKKLKDSRRVMRRALKDFKKRLSR